MIKILIVGASGKMGKAVYEESKKYDNIEVVGGVDKYKDPEFKFPLFDSINDVNLDVDVIVDYSRPETLNDLLNFATSKKVPAIICTTGLSDDQVNKIKEAAKTVALFRSGNMSIGINVLNNILKQISNTLFENYDIEIIEKHHNQKVDAPSGTALLLGDTIREAIQAETEYVFGRSGNNCKRQKKEIGVHAIRGGSIVGEHEVIFAGASETIELKHTATSREVFAVGTMKAVQFMADKETGLYNMDDVLNS